MKKILSIFVGAAVCCCSAVGFVGCDTSSNQSSDTVYSVYMPDGAPALALSPLIGNSSTLVENVNFEYHVVDASTIQTYITGESTAADFCVLPVNLASKLLGTGDNYQMLGTVTHGNLYLLKKAGGDNITVDNLSSLVGKTVGVINLAQVPGLTFKVILNDNNLAFNELGNGSDVASDKVNLKAVSAEEVLPTDTTCDYYVVPEPAATTKVTKTSGKLALAGSLQTLYGGEDGYPQAVLVARKSIISQSSATVSAFINGVTNAAESVKSMEASKIVDAINSSITVGSTSSLNVENLNAQVITNCAIKFVGAQSCKEEVKSFLNKLIAVSASSASTVQDSFFYQA